MFTQTLKLFDKLEGPQNAEKVILGLKIDAVKIMDKRIILILIFWATLCEAEM